MLELLENSPTVELPLSVFLSLLAPARMPLYTISSFPLVDPTIASITFALVDDNDAEHPHVGVSTHILHALRLGPIPQLAIKKSHASFHLPLNDRKTLVIIIAANIGVAPFRGFIQECAAKLQKRRQCQKKEVDLADAVLLIGYRRPDVRHVLQGTL
jgi:cytochrome P450 / NADPH-cytochrome P450 reductase